MSFVIVESGPETLLDKQSGDLEGNDRSRRFSRRLCANSPLFFASEGPGLIPQPTPKDIRKFVASSPSSARAGIARRSRSSRRFVEDAFAETAALRALPSTGWRIHGC